MNRDKLRGISLITKKQKLTLRKNRILPSIMIKGYRIKTVIPQKMLKRKSCFLVINAMCIYMKIQYFHGARKIMK